MQHGMGEKAPVRLHRKRVQRRASRVAPLARG
jgi:hypothetical protein